MDIITILSKSPLFKNVGIDDIKLILDKTHYQIKKFDADHTIAHKGDSCKELRIILKGSVSAEMLHNERAVKIEDLYASQVLAPSFLFGKDTSFPVTIITNEECTILYFNRDGFLKILMSNETILTNYLDIISSRTQTLARRLNLVTLRTIKEKIAQYLLDLAINNNSYFELPMTQTKLANYFAVARAPLTRGFSELERSGIIVMNGRKIKIKDKQKLIGILNKV